MVLKLTVIILLLFAISTSGYFFNQYQQTREELVRLKKNPDEVREEEEKQILARIGSYIKLPQDETPTILTISDSNIDNLKNEPFFEQAKKGDKVVMYNLSKKTILFDPAENKIIEVAQEVFPNLISIPTSRPTIENSPTPTKSIKLRVFIYNGTTTLGLTKSIETLLVEKYPNIIEVIGKDSAVQKTYKKTLVIDLVGTKASNVQDLGKTLDAEISSLPAGENKPEGDILIIVGEDKI